MKRDILKRHIRLTSEQEELSKLEAFIENICDDYHIYDLYFGNILTVNVLAYELFMDRLSGTNYHIDLYFEARRDGMFFTLELGEAFLELASVFDKALKLDASDPESFDGDVDQVLMIRLMSDDIVIKGEEGKIALIFHVSGINELLTQQRIELIEKYFARLTQRIPQS